MSALCCRCLFPTKRQRCSVHSPVASPLGSSLVVSSYLTGRVGLSACCLACCISLPDAIITHKYVPILVLGGIGGLVIGGLIHGWRANI